jgi:O-acetylserine/cysteine efflux transporter
VVVSKLAVDDLGLPPLFYAALRSALVVLALAPLLRRVPENLPRVLGVGLAISGGSFALLFVGLKTASPSAAGIVGLAGAPLTVLFAILILKEQLRWRRALGIALTFVGVAAAIGSPSGLESGWGLGFVFASAVVGALGSVFFKRLAIGAVAMQAWAGLASAIVLFPLSFRARRLPPRRSPSQGASPLPGWSSRSARIRAITAYCETTMPTSSRPSPCSPRCSPSLSARG